MRYTAPFFQADIFLRGKKSIFVGDFVGARQQASTNVLLGNGTVLFDIYDQSAAIEEIYFVSAGFGIRQADTVFIHHIIVPVFMSAVIGLRAA